MAREKGERRDGVLACSDELMTPFRRAIHARCTLFTASPFFSSPPLTTTGETNGVPWTISIVARANPGRCRPVISIVDRGYGDVYQTSEISRQEEIQWVPPRFFFLSLRHLLETIDGLDLFLPRMVELGNTAYQLLSVRVINDRRPSIVRQWIPHMRQWASFSRACLAQARPSCSETDGLGCRQITGVYGVGFEPLSEPRCVTFEAFPF